MKEEVPIIRVNNLGEKCIDWISFKEGLKTGYAPS
jgi:hypothetical protein